MISIEARCDPEYPSSSHRPSGFGLPPHLHFSKCTTSLVTGIVRLCRIVRTLRSTADGASVAAEGDDLLLLLDVLKELDGALQLPAVDSLGGLAGVLERNSEVGTAGLGRLGGRDLGGSVANLWVERSIVTNSTAALRTATSPLAPSQPSAARRFPKLSAAQGAGANRQFARCGLRKSVCTHHLDGVDVEMVSSSSLGVDGRLRVWLGWEVFCWSRTSRSLPNQTVGSPVKSFCAPANHTRRRCPARTRAPYGARRGYLGTGPTLVLKFFNFFLLQQQKLSLIGFTSCNCTTRQRLTFTSGIDILPCCSHAEV